MRQVIVRYRLKPDQVERNEALVRAVYDELARAQPDGFHYATFKLEDGVSFVHVAVARRAESAARDRGLPRVHGRDRGALRGAAGFERDDRRRLLPLRPGQQLTQCVHPVPHVDEPCRQRGQAESDHVRAAKIRNNVALDQLRAQALRVRVGEGHVRAAEERVARRGDREPAREPLVGERDRVLGAARCPSSRIAPIPASATSRTPSSTATSERIGGDPDSRPAIPAAGT